MPKDAKRTPKRSDEVVISMTALNGRRNGPVAPPAPAGAPNRMKQLEVIDPSHARDLTKSQMSKALGKFGGAVPLGGTLGVPLAAHHHKRPTCVAVAPGQGVVTCDDNGDVILWDLTGKKVRRIGNHAKKASYVVFSNGNVFVAGYDGTVKIWDINSNNGQPRVKFDQHAAGSEVWTVAVASNGTRVLSATNGGEILMWDVDWAHATGTLVGAAFSDSPEAVGALAFVPPASAGGAETAFLSGHADGQMIKWDITNPAAPAVDQRYPHNNSHLVNSVAVTSNGAVAVSTSLDMTARVWDLTSVPPPKYTRAHDDLVWRVAMSPDDSNFATASQDGKVRVWRLSDGFLNTWFDAGEGSMGVAFLENDRIAFTVDGVQPSKGVNFGSFTP